MREWILNNFWWKTTAFLLAVLAWYGFKPRETRPTFFPDPLRPHFTRYLVAHPITISKPATDPREFKVSPSVLDVTLSGDEKILRSLDSSEVRATVDVGEFDGRTNTLGIRLFVPPQGGIRLEKMVPERVQVELLKP
jgi:hypothetical protein